jgi:hypothetical protein
MPRRPKSTIAEKVEVRTLAVYYFRELSGPGVFNEVADRLYRIRPSSLDILKEQSDYVKDDQLVDYVISVRTYRQSLTPGWIARHADDWGGLANRWADTRGRYIHVLARDDDPDSAGLILDILETTEALPAAEQLDDFATMIRRVDIDDLRQTLTRESARDKESAARIEALQRRWHLALVRPAQR